MSLNINEVQVDNFTLYLTEAGQETLITSTEDPVKIHRIYFSRSMTKRIKKPGNSARILKNGKNCKIEILERLCLDLYLQSQQA